MTDLPDFLQPGSEIVTVDDVRSGDLVRFRRVSGNRVEIHVVRGDELKAPPEDLRRIFAGPQGMSFIPVEESAEELRAWESVRKMGVRAKEQGSHWNRYSIPAEVIDRYSPQSEPPRKRSLDEIEMPENNREQIRSLFSGSRKAPRPPEPMQALIGVRFEEPGKRVEERLDYFAERFPTGATLELSGVRSASMIAPPALFAAGAYGALFNILVSDAAVINYSKLDREFLLPLSCRCRVDGRPGPLKFKLEAGSLSRPCLNLTQIDEFRVS